MRVLDVPYLVSKFEKDTRHTTGLCEDILPYTTKLLKDLEKGIHQTIGRFITKSGKVKIDIKRSEDTLVEPNVRLIELIADQIEFNNDEDNRVLFEKFLAEYLFDSKQLRIVHPYLFNYVNFGDGKNFNLDKIADFMREILVDEPEEFNSLFLEKSTDNLLLKVIVNGLPDLEKSTERELDYKNHLSVIKRFYQQDLNFLKNHKEYFTDKFELLTTFYLFMYSCQLIVKFEKQEKAQYHSLDGLYFSIETEQLSKKRKAAGDYESYNYVNSKSEKLFAHMHVLAQLSHIIYPEQHQNYLELEKRKDQKVVQALTYKDIRDLIENKVINQNMYEKDLKEWIEQYSKLQNLSINSMELEDKNYSELISVLIGQVRRGMADKNQKEFGKNALAIGKKSFVKQRGSLGNVFNLTHESFYLIAAVVIKDKRIPLNELFDGFEKRGIKFDRHSKMEVLRLLEKINVIDKKSDSGDAQYVKPIL